jgi:hypothetical protein
LKRQQSTSKTRLEAAKTEYEKTILQREIDATDKQIDNLVYELTEEEIKIVEGKERSRGLESAGK